MKTGNVEPERFLSMFHECDLGQVQFLEGLGSSYDRVKRSFEKVSKGPN